MGSLGAMVRGRQGPLPPGRRRRTPTSSCPRASRAWCRSRASSRPFVYQLVGGLRAGMGYCGARDDRGAVGAARASCASPRAGMRESHPHDMTITKESRTTSRNERRRPERRTARHPGRRPRRAVRAADRAPRARGERLVARSRRPRARSRSRARMQLAGVILSGGPASVYASDAPSVPRELLELGVPVLGICYGMQWMVQALGGAVRRLGRARVRPHLDRDRAIRPACSTASTAAPSSG